ISRRLPGAQAQFAGGNPPFRLIAHVHQHFVAADMDNPALNDIARRKRLQRLIVLLDGIGFGRRLAVVRGLRGLLMALVFREVGHTLSIPLIHHQQERVEPLTTSVLRTKSLLKISLVSWRCSLFRPLSLPLRSLSGQRNRYQSSPPAAAALAQIPR